MAPQRAGRYHRFRSNPAAHAPLTSQEVAMTTRRGFITVSAVGGMDAAPTPPAALTPRGAAAAPKSMTVTRESSCIKPFDDYFAQKLTADYEKQTGIKIVYEAVSVGGMLIRLTETG